jgi:predicted nucleic acid-binding protein
MALVIDTGPLLAALDTADPDHERCAQLISGTHEELVVPGLVLAELDYWCHQRLGNRAWLTFLEDLLAGAYTLESPTLVDLERCQQIQRQYEDQSIGVVDASVLALVERMGEEKVATLDHRHFSVMRPAHRPALSLLP